MCAVDKQRYYRERQKRMRHNRALGPLSGLPEPDSFYRLPPTPLVGTEFKDKLEFV
jgi:hypothetical protein